MNVPVLSSRTQHALRACQMKSVEPPSNDWGKYPLAQGPHPRHIYIGQCPPTIDDGSDFIFWAVGLGFQPDPSLGNWPFTVVTFEPALGTKPLAVLAYFSDTTSLTIWASTTDAQTSLPRAFPTSGRT